MPNVPSSIHLNSPVHFSSGRREGPTKQVRATQPFHFFSVVELTMKKLLILIFLPVVCCTPASKESDSPIQAVFPFGKEHFDWSSIKTDSSTEEKQHFRSKRPWLLTQDSITCLSNIHTVDLNDDGHLDIVYSGDGPATLQTIISIGNKEDDFVFDGYLVDLALHENRLSRLYLVSILSTGAPVILGQTIVEVTFANNLPRFSIAFSSETIGGIQPPKPIQPYDGEVIADSLVARFAPIAVDTPYNDLLEQPGNRLGLLTNGTQGTMVGHHIDSLNNSWLCMLVHPRHAIIGYPYINNVFDSTDRTRRMVWIPGSGVRKYPLTH